MKIFELPFAKILKIDESIAEIIIDEGVEVSSGMIDQVMECCLANFSTPIGILENKINSYNYTFRAQMKIVKVDDVEAIAIVVYSDLSRKTTESLRKLPGEVNWKMRIFDGRKHARAWLQSQMAGKPAMA